MTHGSRELDADAAYLESMGQDPGPTVESMTPVCNQFSVVLLNEKFCAIVNKNDVRRVKRHSWHVHVSRGKGRNAGQPYARTTIKGKKVYLHRFLTDCPEGFHVDHKNHQTLDCRRMNLEIITHEENQKRRRNCKKGKCK